MNKFATKGTHIQGHIDPLGVIVVKELHDIQQQVEGLTQLPTGTVAGGLVAVSYTDG